MTKILEGQSSIYDLLKNEVEVNEEIINIQKED